MNTPAIAGQHQVVASEPDKPARSLPWITVITAAVVFALLAAVGHYGQFAPGIDNPGAVIDIGKYLCERNDGLRHINLHPAPNRYTFKCRDGAVFPAVRVDIREPTNP